MFRIRLPAGGETEYDSVAALAQAIRGGLVPGNSEIYHRTSQRWLPISAHPAWDEAAPRPEGSMGQDGLTQPHPGQPVWGKTVRIYQMYSQSGREIAERRRPTWIAPLASLCAVVALVTGLGVALAPTARVPDGAVRPAAVHQRLPGTVPPPAFATVTSQSWPDAPYNLAERMAQTADSAAHSLTQGFRQLGLPNLLAMDRLQSLDSLHAGRDALRAFRDLLDDYRATRTVLAEAYRDSAASLVKIGSWTAIDYREWLVRAVPPEPPAEQARADSVLSLYEGLYRLLVDQAGLYTWEPGAIQFKEPETLDNYQRMRAGLIRFVTPRDPYREPLSASLSLLLPTPGDTIPPAVLAAGR